MYPILNKDDEGNNVHIVPVDDIDHDFKEVADQDFLEQMQDGIVQPITLNKDLKVVDGKKRLNAAKELGIKSIKAIIMA